LALDAILILGFGMGVQAAALDIALAQLLVWPWLLWRVRRIGELRLPAAAFRLRWKPTKGMLAMAIPMAMQNSVALVGVLLLQAVVNGLGIVHVAAFGVAMRIFFFIKEPSVAMSHALAAYVGQNIGTGSMQRVREGISAALRITLPVCVAVIMVIFVFGRHMAAWVVTAREVQTIEMAYLLLRILAGMLPVLYLMYVLRAVLQGMGRTVTLMASGAVEMVLRSVCALTLPMAIGAAGIGIAETGAWLGAMLLYLLRVDQVMRTAPSAVPRSGA
jgi:Na+-driven multidrug efflux pump